MAGRMARCGAHLGVSQRRKSGRGNLEYLADTRGEHSLASIGHNAADFLAHLDGNALFFYRIEGMDSALCNVLHKTRSGLHIVRRIVWNNSPQNAAVSCQRPR